jgi:tetratricopeptide (TPR) repeat protein
MADSLSWFERAKVLERDGDIEGAVAAIRKGLALDSGAGIFWTHLGTLLERLERSAEAEIAFLKGIEVNPSSAVAHSSLATLLLDLERPAEAEAFVRRSIELKPAAHRYTILGVALNHQFRRAESREAYEAALRLDPDFEEAMFNLAASLLDIDPARSRKLLNRVIEIDQEWLEALEMLEHLDRLNTGPRS